MRFVRPAALLLGLLAAALGRGQEKRWYLSAFNGQSVIFLGSTDPRRAEGIGFGYDFGPANRLRWGEVKGHLLMEGYYHFSTSPGAGVRRWGPNSSQSWGLLALSRYTWTNPGAPTMFADIGWGLQIASRATRDLESKLNSTPIIDLGVVIGKEERAFVGARFLHMSNAGLVGDNRGQNQIFFLVQFPF